MAFPLTNEQKAVVDDRGGRLLVAAAAGSGKTRVLVERLLDRIDPPTMNEGTTLYNVTDFLVITFTNDAAAELKHRIAGEIRSRIKEGSTNARHLHRQLALLPQANISTIHKFCGKLISEHGHKIDVNPGCYGLANEEAIVLQNQVLEEVLDLWYSKKDNEDFLYLVDTLSAGRDDEKLSDMLLDVYKKIQSHENPKQWLTLQKNMWDIPPDTDLAQTVWGSLQLDFLREEAGFYLTRVEEGLKLTSSDQQAKTKYGSQFATLKDYLENIQTVFCQEELEWAQAVEAIALVYPGAGKKGMDDEDLKEQLKKLWGITKKGIEKLKLQPEKQVLEELRAVAPSVKTLMDVVESFSEHYQEAKKERNALDFGDLEHFAVKLLVNEQEHPTDIAKLCSAQFQEVMVDEFQDTNKVQNVIFRAVSQNSTRLFLVGDAKQAIYLFRLADPSIFAKMFSDSPLQEVNDPPMPVGEPRNRMLKSNFRSREEVLYACNDFFVETMTPELGGTDYREHGMLVAGATFPPHNDPNYYNTELNILDTLQWSFGDTEVENKNEAEAIWVAQRVGKLLDERFLISNEQGDGLRPVKPDDIMVLLRSPKSVMKYYYKAFRQVGVNLASHQGEDVFECREVDVAHGFLQIIDNPLQDIPLLAVLTSPLFSFTPEDLTILRQGRSGPFYQAFISEEWMKKLEHSALELGEEASTIVERVKKKRDDFLGLLKKFREASWEKSPRELLWYVYEECHFMGVFGGLSQGEDRQEILLEFYRMVGSLEDNGYKTLFRLLAQLEELKKVKMLPQRASSHGGEGMVSLYSIHKSKGLEKPVVIVAGLGKEFNLKSQNAPLVFHQDYGVGPTGLDKERKIYYPTLAKTIINKVQKNELVAEELRMLYVAMTRAKEKLIMSISLGSGLKKLSSMAGLATKPLRPSHLKNEMSLGGFLVTYAVIRPDGGGLLQQISKDTDITPDRSWEPHFTSHWDIRVVDSLEPEETTEPATETTEVDAETCETLPSHLDSPEHEVEIDWEDLKEKCAQRYQWDYPHKGDSVIPSKFTATQTKGRKLVFEVTEEAETEVSIKKMETYPDPEGLEEVELPTEEIEKKVFKQKRKPSFTQKKATGLDAAARGTAIHLVMQYLDLPNLKDYSLEKIADFIKQLVEEGKVSQEQAEVVSPAQIIAFLESSWGVALRDSDYCKQEFKFSLLMEGKKLGFDTEESLLLQGVVDCFYKNKEGKLVIIDFKSDKISKGKLEEKAKEHVNQMLTYGEALERITGCPVVEKVLWFFSIDEGVQVI